MINIMLPDEIARQIEAVAKIENRPVEEVVASMVKQYTPQPTSQEESDAAFESIIGIFDDDITDLSTTVRETLHEYFHDKYGDSTDVLNRLEDLARRENRSILNLLTSWLDEHTAEETEPQKVSGWDLILGIGDENVTDMSTTVRETLHKKA